MFVRKNILLKKHKGSLINKITLKKKDDKIFIVSEATNKYPVRYNNANANIGHFNHITETPSAYVHDLNGDINEGFIKHDYSDLYDQDLLENVEDVKLMPDTSVKEFDILDYDNNNSRWRYAYYSSDQSKVRELNVKGDWVIKNLNDSVMLTNTVTGESFSKSLPYGHNFGACIFLYGDTDTHCIFGPKEIPFHVTGSNYSNVRPWNFQKFIEFDKINKTFTLYRNLYLNITNSIYIDVQSVVLYPDINASIYVPTQRLFVIGVEYYVSAGVETSPSNYPGRSFAFKLSETYTTTHYDPDLQYLSIGSIDSIVRLPDGRTYTVNDNRADIFPAELHFPNSDNVIRSSYPMLFSHYNIVESQLLSTHLAMDGSTNYYIRLISTDLELIQDGQKHITISGGGSTIRGTYIKSKQKTIKLPLIENFSSFNLNDSGSNLHCDIQSNSKLIILNISKNVFNSTVRVRLSGGQSQYNDYADKEYGPSYTADDPESYALEGQDYVIQVRNLDGLDANSKRYNVDGIGLAKIEVRRFNPPLIETNKLYQSSIKYDNPLLNRSFEDELFDRNLANTDYIRLPPYAVSDGIIALKGDYSLPNWWLGIPGIFLCSSTLDGYSRSISELRVYGDASVVGTLNGQYSTNKAQTLYYKQDIVKTSGQVISKDTNLSFDISYEAYGDSKIFEIEGKVIDLSNIVNMSKCTFTQKGNVLTDINSEQMFAFDFWSVESSVAPASTLYFELDVKVYKNMTKQYDYINADYDIITLKAVNYKPSGRYFAFSISVDTNELFVESYAGNHTYNVFPAIWSGNYHPTPSTFHTEANRQHLLIPRETKHSTIAFRYVANNYSILPKTAIKNPDEYITLIKATEFTKDYEIVYINVIPIDDFTTRIRFKVKLNKGLNFKTKVAIIVDSDDLFIEFDDSKYSQLIFNIDHNSIIELKISSKQLPINNELISNILYKIEDIDTSIQYINIKDI